jgi:glycosyltransferase involved in cell wall biosynthesis
MFLRMGEGKHRKLAFVTPWYSEILGGGAETACRTLAHLLNDSGIDVEVFTTCVRDFRSDWSTNYHPPGKTIENSIPVHRFPVKQRNVKAFDAVNAKLMSGKRVTAAEEETFSTEMIHSPALYDFIARHRESYVFAFIPYLFGTTFAGCRQVPECSILIPCLHDEPYARLGVMKEAFTSVKGAFFLSKPERDLAVRLYGETVPVLGVFGLPIDTGWVGDPARVQSKYGLRRFLLYAGRTDPGKGADVLLRYFARYLRETAEDLSLVFIGPAKVDVPPAIARNVHVLGFVSEQDKRDCLAAAQMLCVPSVMESYSIVLMESWIARRPVLVNEACAVTADFCRRSNGGLWFRNYDDFHGVLTWMKDNPDLAAAMGQNGRDYVVDEFSPEVVARKYVESLRSLLY